MSGTINKVDMSLDDIIKLNKKNKVGVSPLNRAKTGKGNGSVTNNRKNSGRFKGLRRTQDGKINKNDNALNVRQKRMNALKKLREAKQALALLDSKKTGRNNFQRRGSQNLNKSAPQQQQQQQRQNNNRPRINRNYGSNVSQNQSLQQQKRHNVKRNYITTLSPNQSQQNNQVYKKTKINRNYGSQLSLTQLSNTNKKVKKNFNSVSNISLSSLGTSNSNNHLNTSKRQRNNRGRQNQTWNNTSFDDTLTVSVSNIGNNTNNKNNRHQRQNRNRRRPNNSNIVNLKVQQGKHRDYDFDANVFSSIGTTVPLNQRFSNKSVQSFQSENSERQVFF